MNFFYSNYSSLPDNVPVQRPRALSKNMQLQQDYKKHMVAAAALNALKSIKKEDALSKADYNTDCDTDYNENNEDQENYHNYAHVHRRQSEDDQLNVSATDLEQGVSVSSLAANARQGQPHPAVNKRKKSTMQSLEALDFGDTADELDTDYDNIDDYEQAPASNQGSANLDDLDEDKQLAKKSGQNSVFLDDDTNTANSGNSIDGNRFQFPVLSDPNYPGKMHRPRSNSLAKKIAALTAQSCSGGNASGASGKESHSPARSICGQQQQQQLQQQQNVRISPKSHLVQALTQNSLLINGTKEMRQIRSQQQQQQQQQQPLTPIMHSSGGNRKRPHSQTFENESCGGERQSASTISSLLSPSLLSGHHASFLSQHHSAVQASNLISPTLLNNYIQ